MQATNGMQVSSELVAIQQRNKVRIAAATKAMGTKYLCHPANAVKRTDSVGKGFSKLNLSGRVWRFHA